MQDPLELLVSGCVKECPLIKPLEALSFDDTKELRLKIDNFHKKNEFYVKQGHEQFGQYSRAMETNLKAIHDMFEDKTLLKNPDYLDISHFLSDPSVQLPPYFEDIFNHELTPFLLEIQTELQDLYQKQFTEAFKKKREPLLAQISQLFTQTVQIKCPQKLIHHLSLLETSLTNLHTEDKPFRNLILDVSRRIFLFAQHMIQNFKNFSLQCQSERNLFFQDSQLAKDKLYNLPFQDPQLLLADRYQPLKVEDARCLALDTDLVTPVLSFVLSYLSERNLAFKSRVFVFPLEFFPTLSPTFDPATLHYDRVRNITRHFHNQQNIFEHFEELLLYVNVKSTKVLVQVRNGLMKQILIHECVNSYRDRIAQIIRGYIYYECLDKGGITSDAALAFADEYTVLAVVVPPWLNQFEALHSLFQLKQFADGLPWHQAVLEGSHILEFKQVIFELILEIGHKKDALGYEHLF